MPRRIFLVGCCLLGVGCSVLGVLAASVARADESFSWELWRELPVHSGGRQQPLDTLARETLRTVANGDSLADPITKQRLHPTAAYVSMMFDWRGWDHSGREQLALVGDWHPLYFPLHEADEWDRLPLLDVDSATLRWALGLEKGQRRVSPFQLAGATIEDRRTERRLPFATWAGRLQAGEESGEELTPWEKEGVELARRLWLYQDHRMGRGLEVLPVEESERGAWMSVAQLLLTKFDDTNDPSGDLRQCQQLFAQARKSFQQRDAAGFNRASEQLLSTLRQKGMQSGDYPSRRAMTLEVTYHRWAPLRMGWMLMLVAVAGLWLHVRWRWKSLRAGAFAAYGVAVVAVAIGLAVRIAIAGRPPVTNLYESVVFVGAGIAVLGLILGFVYRNVHVLTAAATVSTAMLVMADGCPSILDPAVRPLEPVLQSNFWLVAHVLTITLSYAAFALAAGMANITLGHYLLRSNNQAVIKSLSRATYRAMQVGVLTLAAGMILGAIWADYSWGCFWGWDPKEVWALITLLGYLAILHARQAGWVRERGLAALSIAVFSLVVMAWYGVNQVLGTGLHNFGLASGGGGLVVFAVLLQLVFVAIVLLRSWRGDAAALSRLGHCYTRPPRRSTS